VCLISAPSGAGTGFIIGPHTILTAAHVVSGITGDFNIYIGNSNSKLNGTLITANSANVYIDRYFSSLLPIAQFDFAIINVPEDLSGYGSFQLLPNYSGGTINITGYGFSNSLEQSNDIGTVTPTLVPGAFVEGTVTSYKGDSGGPLWVYNGSTAQAVGIVSGALSLSGALDSDVQLTAADWQQIQNWENVPILQLPSSLSVTPGQPAQMGIVVTPADSDDTVSVTISGVPKFETVTAGPGENVTHKGSSYTVRATIPGVSISDLTLSSSFKGNGAPVNDLSITATNVTNGETATSSSQIIAVTDPPADTKGQTGLAVINRTSDPSAFPVEGSSPGLANVVALFNQFITAGFPDHNGIPITNALSQIVTDQQQFLAQPHHG
jgi:V8-like Glu-specific endopeptidase